jgi:uncharacterized membrane protein/putative flippase GtrA
MNIAVLIPAYRPEPQLLDLLRALAANFPNIILVDDGSGAEYSPIFEAASAISNVHLLSHTENRGKGDALKTGLKFIHDTLPRCIGVVTADADGQHHPADVLKVAERLEASPGTLVLGARQFDGPVPLRSRFGNILTRFALRWIGGARLTDSQTGLRGIPRAFIAPLLQIPSSGYEFELDMLLLAKHASIEIVEQPIRTIYTAGNPTSHFNPLLDSLKIYFVLLRFSLVSLVTAALDNTIFFIAFQAGAGVLQAQIAGRLVAVVFNYAGVRSAVFHSHREHRVALPRYLALVAVSGTASYFLISWMSHGLGIPVMLAKLYAEAGLFLLNFLVQRDLIFTRRKKPSVATDWNAYYRSTPLTARLTRRYTGSVLVKTMQRYAADPGGCLVELGGANSCFLERITQEVAPRTYHVIDTNQYGLELLSRRVVKNSRLVLHRGDVRERPPDIRADLVFSVGLIEHFDPEDTARAVDTHFQMVKPGGCVILSFPTPTLLYRAARLLTEAVGLWKFHDERPLQRDEVAASVARHAEILHEQILWPLVFTQHLVVARKWSSQPASGATAPALKVESPPERRPWLARLFLCLGIPMGLTYGLVMPPNQVPDEWAHFMRTCDISRGKLVSTLIVDVPPGFAPVWERFTPALDVIQPRRLPIHKEEWLSVLHNSGGSVYTGPVLANYGGNLYSFIPYLPAAITVAIARGLGAPMLGIYYAARFTNLALYLGLIWLALRITPRFHLLFFVLALMPMALHQAASASADAASISLTFLYIAVVLHLAFGSRPQPLGLREYVILAIPVVALSLVKFNLALVLLPVLISPTRFTSPKARILFVVGCLLLASAAAGLWQAVNRQNVQLFLRDVATPANADLAWRNPGWFFESVGQTILKDAFFYRQAFVGSLAHLSIQLPVWLQQLYLLLLAVIAITENPPAAFRARARWLCLGVLVVTVITLFAFMLTANTPKTEITHWVNISGIQGRYFIPIAPLGFMLLSNRWLAIKSRVNRIAISSAAILVILLASRIAWSRIYATFWSF